MLLICFFALFFSCVSQEIPKCGRYVVVSNRTDPFGISGFARFVADPNPPPSPSPIVQNITFFVDFESVYRFRIRIFDNDTTRWRVPQSFFSVPDFRTLAEPPVFDFHLYSVQLLVDPLGFAVTRYKGGTIFRTVSPLFRDAIFLDQYLEISTELAGPDPFLYGFPERIEHLRLPLEETYNLWNADANIPHENKYGSHPFYLQMDDDEGSCHIILFASSNALSATLSQYSLTFKSTGGIFDFYFLMGPSPANALVQYAELVGKPFFPPLWSLGWQQSRWGYRDIATVKRIVGDYDESGLPLDAIWTDIDYMQYYRIFTYDELRFPSADMKEFHNWLAQRHQCHVMIIDSSVPLLNYPPYNAGVADGIFVRSPADASQPLLSRLYPADFVLFPDFTHPNASQWWQAQLADFFYLGGDADGIWIDRDEPATFCDAQYPNDCRVMVGPDYSNPPANMPIKNTTDAMKSMGSEQLPIPLPPYSPTFGATLETNTLNISSHHFIGRHYDVHNMYGLNAAKVTFMALLALHNEKRPFVLSRSTWIGSGQYGASSTGDNAATWDFMRMSIPELLMLSMAGISHAGADICGFNENSTDELCARWTALGCFYPFARNHNTWSTSPQEPFAFGPNSAVMKVSSEYIKLRYSLLLYLYTGLWQAHDIGSPFLRPLFVDFPADRATWEVEAAFMFGPALYVAPVLNEGHTSVSVYFPSACWYSLFDFSLVNALECSQTLPSVTISISARLDESHSLPVFIQGGSVFALQATDSIRSSADLLSQPLQLIVALDGAHSAQGVMFFDDGFTTSNSFTLSHFDFEPDAVGGFLLAVDSDGTDGGFPAFNQVIVHSIVFAGIPCAHCTSESVFHIRINNHSHVDVAWSVPFVLPFDPPIALANLTSVALRLHSPQSYPSSFPVFWVIVAVVAFVCVILFCLYCYDHTIVLRKAASLTSHKRTGYDAIDVEL